VNRNIKIDDIIALARGGEICMYQKESTRAYLDVVPIDKIADLGVHGSVGSFGISEHVSGEPRCDRSMGDIVFYIGYWSIHFFINIKVILTSFWQLSS
jgi:hypothetical protein